MPRKTKAQLLADFHSKDTHIQKAGVPPKPIDWNQVDMGLMAGCPATEIAADLGICVDTLLDRCVQEKGVYFSAYRQEKSQKGLSLLRRKQYAKAISGNTTMLTLLGVEMLGQGQKKTSGSLPNLSDLNEKALSGELEEIMKQPDGI